MIFALLDPDPDYQSQFVETCSKISEVPVPNVRFVPVAKDDFNNLFL